MKRYREFLTAVAVALHTRKQELIVRRVRIYSDDPLYAALLDLFDHLFTETESAYPECY